MLEMIKGAKVPFADLLYEGYSINDNVITANVNATKIKKVLSDFIKAEKAELFCLFIEVPSKLDDENIIRKATNDKIGILHTSHLDVYYLDGIKKDEITKILNTFHDILVNDGLCNFGVLSQNNNELGKYKYNILIGHSKSGDFSAAVNAFENNGISKVSDFKNAWDYISAESPGSSEVYEIEEKNVYDVIKLLEKLGMYKAYQREIT